MKTRYDSLFESLRARKEGAFVPFLVLGDPDPETSLRLLEALVQGGADALELGIPFSDPVADGPTIQAADSRALGAGVRPKDAWEILRRFRERGHELPIGLLVYANLLESQGVQRFYARARAAGVDSVLVADLPSVEAGPWAELAVAEGVAPVLVAPPDASEGHPRDIARLSEGYTYVVTRRGVTGADEDEVHARAEAERRELLRRLARLGAPPSVLGFGIASPEHVRGALAAGAAGAISGSAVIRRVEAHLADEEAMLCSVRDFVASMKAATRSV